MSKTMDKEQAFRHLADNYEAWPTVDSTTPSAHRGWYWVKKNGLMVFHSIDSCITVNEYNEWSNSQLTPTVTAKRGEGYPFEWDRERTLAAMVEHMVSWPETEKPCDLGAWYWSDVSGQMVLTNAAGYLPIHKSDWLAAKDKLKVPAPTSEIYTMGLHDEIQLGESTAIRRVPGGWIYLVSHPRSDHMTSDFVPYSEEFFL